MNQTSKHNSYFLHQCWACKATKWFHVVLLLLWARWPLVGEARPRIFNHWVNTFAQRWKERFIERFLLRWDNRVPLFALHEQRTLSTSWLALPRERRASSVFFHDVSTVRAPSISFVTSQYFVKKKKWWCRRWGGVLLYELKESV